jgi:hypothetical protein
MVVPKLSWLIFAIYCTSSIAYNIATAKQPLGPLGVTLDYSLAVAFPENTLPKSSSVPRNFVFSSHLMFQNPVSQIRPGQLWQIAIDAYRESKPSKRGGKHREKS